MKKKTTPHTLLLVDARRILKLVSPELKKTLMNCWSYDLIEQNYVLVGFQALDWMKKDEYSHPDLKALLLELFGIGLPDYKEGDLLFVRARGSNIWELMYFSHFNTIGDAMCYSVQYKKYHITNPYAFHELCPVPLPEIN